MSNGVGYPQRFARFWDVGVESCKVSGYTPTRPEMSLDRGSGSAVKFAKRFGAC